MNSIDETLKKFVVKYFAIICLLSLLHIITDYFLGLYFLVYSLIGSLIFHFILFVSIYKLRFEYIRPFIFMYLSIISIALYFLVSSSWRNFSIIFIWFFTIPLTVKYIYQSKKTLLYWNLFILFIALVAIGTPDEYLLIKYLPERQNSQINFWLNFINIITFIILFTFFINSEYEVEKSRMITNTATKDNNIDKKASYYIDIFSKIEKYFETHKPWKNSDFKLSDLAIAINSNNTYVSHSINYCSGMNFNFFVNKYRIEFIKSLLIDKNNRGEKMKTIYLKAGFKQQTTFNKAFKHFEKVTPSEYIIKLEE